MENELLCPNKTTTELLNLLEKKIDNINEDSITTISNPKEKSEENTLENIEKKEYLKKWEKNNKEKRARKKKEWAIKNRDKIKEYQLQWKQQHPEYFKKYKDKKGFRKIKKTPEQIKLNKLEKQKIYKLKHKEKIREYTKNRRLNDLNYKLSCNLRSRLNIAVQNNYKSGSAVRDLGCSIEEFKKYIESKWLPGMNWDNWKLDGWHIDHIKPLNNFDLTDRKQLLEAVHFTNLQPLWADDNRKKYNN